MRTSRDANKHASNQTSGRYTSGGFIPSSKHTNDSKGCLGSLLVILLPAMGIIAYIALQVV